MNRMLIAVLVPIVFAIAGATAITLWVTRNTPMVGVALRVAQTDSAKVATGDGGPTAEAGPSDGPGAGPNTATGGTSNPGEKTKFQAGSGKPSAEMASFPCFRGSAYDGISANSGKLARSWPAGGPRVLWEIKDLGDGYAGPAIANGCVYLLDYDMAGGNDVLRCLSLTDGKEVWRRWYADKKKPNHGMSRTVPTVSADGKYVVTMGPNGYLLCADAKTGAEKWFKDIREYPGSKVPEWYSGQCPVIDGDKVIVAPCGKDALMVALECETGKEVWKAPNPKNYQMSHSTILPMTYKGTKMYAYVTLGASMVGVSTEGKLLWDVQLSTSNIVAEVPQPVIIGEGKLFIARPTGGGAIITQLDGSGSNFTAKIVRTMTRNEFGSEQMTPIFYNGHIYGNKSGGEFVCLDADGNKVWGSGTDRSAGKTGGGYLIADGLIFVMGDQGELALLEANASGYKKLASAQIPNAVETWAPLALVNGRLIARTGAGPGRLICYDVAQH